MKLTPPLGILLIAIVDCLYGFFVAPFFIQNYIHNYWDMGAGYCGFYTYLFTFHDCFVPFLLIIISTYISLRYSGN